VTAHVRPWSTVLRVPLLDRQLWFKACGPAQAFEPRLTAALFARWPDRTPELLAHDDARGWMLLADAGTPIRAVGNPPEVWLQALPRYAELQRGEAPHAADHLAHGVPDLRIATWPARFVDLMEGDLPLQDRQVRLLRQFAPRFSELCAELAADGRVPQTVQHDDLHMANVYQTADQRLRLLDWGDASISHPFASLVVTFRFLEEVNHLASDDRWFPRLRDAYLEPWGSGFSRTFRVALRAGAFAHAFACLRQRKLLPPEARRAFDTDFRVVLGRALAQIYAGPTQE
jgi:hypothetical protein